VGVSFAKIGKSDCVPRCACSSFNNTSSKKQQVSYDTAGAVTFGSTALLFTPTSDGASYTYGAWAGAPTDPALGDQP
jgi:hypothetical protein